MDKDILEKFCNKCRRQPTPCFLPEHSVKKYIKETGKCLFYEAKYTE